MQRQYVYRAPPTYRPQYYRARDYRPYELSWLYNRQSQQYIVADVSAGITSASVFYGASPSVSTGDIFVADLLDSLGSPITLNANGTLSIASGGSTASRTFSFDVYDVSASAFYGATTAYINDAAPVFSSTEVVIAVERNQTITPVDMSGNGSDPEGDALTWSLTSTPPGTISLSSSGVWSGLAPDANSITPQTGFLSDIAGNSVPWTATLIVGRIVEPNVFGLTQAAATGLLAASYLNPVIGTPVNSETVPIGAVVSQVPAALNEVAPFSDVTIALSLGTTGPVTKLSEIPSRTYAQSTRGATLYLSLYQSGASVFSVSPPTLGISDSIADLPLDVVGIFGPFVITAINGAGTSSVTFAPFTYTVVPVTTPIVATFERPATTLRLFLLQ